MYRASISLKTMIPPFALSLLNARGWRPKSNLGSVFGLTFEKLLELVGVYAGHGDVRTKPVNHQCQQQEHKPATQIAVLAALGQLVCRSCQNECP